MHLGSYSSGQRREVLLSANVEFWKLQLPRGHRLRGSFSFPSSWPSGLLLRDQRDWVSLEKTCILNWGVCGFCHIPARFGGSSSQSQELPISLSPFLFPVETPPVSTRTLYSPAVILHCHSWCPWSPTVSSQHPLSETWASLCSAPSMRFTLIVTFLVFMLMEQGSLFLPPNPRSCSELEFSRAGFYYCSSATPLLRDLGQIIPPLWDSLSPSTKWRWQLLSVLAWGYVLEPIS